MNPVIVSLTYADVYGYSFEPSPNATLPPVGTPPSEWRKYHFCSVVRLAPYNAEDATTDQRFEHECWVDNDPANDPSPEYRTEPTEPPTTYHFATTYSQEFGYRVEVLPDYLVGL